MILVATPTVPTVPHYGQTAAITSALQSSGMVPQFFPPGRGQIQQLRDPAGFPQPVCVPVPVDAVRMVHTRPFLYNQRSAQYRYQDPNYGGQPYVHPQQYHQYQPLYPGISNSDDNNRSSPIIQEIEDENDKKNQNSNVMAEDVPEINENIQKVGERSENKLNSAKMLPEHATNDTSKDYTQSKYDKRVERPQSNQHSAGQQDFKEGTLPKDDTREDDFNSSIGSASDTCKRKTSPNETSPAAVGSETKPKKPRGNNGTGITVHEAIPNSPASQTCRNVEVVEIESQRSSNTYEIDGKGRDEVNDLVSNIEDIDIKDGQGARPDDRNDTIDKGETESHKDALCQADSEGKVFGDASSSGGKEKQDAGTSLFTSTTEIKMGATTAENWNSNKQSNTLQEEGLTSNSSAFWQEVVHTKDRSNTNATGMSPDVGNASKNSLSEECPEKGFSQEEKTGSNCGPLQKRPSLDKGDSTNILNGSRDSEQNEKTADRDMEHDVPKDGKLSKTNEDAKVLFS